MVAPPQAYRPCPYHSSAVGQTRAFFGRGGTVPYAPPLQLREGGTRRRRTVWRKFTFLQRITKMDGLIDSRAVAAPGGGSGSGSSKNRGLPTQPGQGPALWD